MMIPIFNGLQWVVLGGVKSAAHSSFCKDHVIWN